MTRVKDVTLEKRNGLQLSKKEKKIGNNETVQSDDGHLNST